jgi:hypothetical protein
MKTDYAIATGNAGPSKGDANADCFIALATQKK